MIMQRFGFTALAAALVLAAGAKVSAQDTVRLVGTGDATVQSLLFDGQADTEPVYYRGWRGYHGWGGYRGWGYGGWGHRGWGYAGFYRPYIYRPFVYRPYYGYRAFYGYAPYFYGYTPYAYNYYSPSYYAPPVYSYYVNPYAADIPVLPGAVVLGTSSYGQRSVFQTFPKTPQVDLQPLLPPQSGAGTYHYDGGPSQLTPLPSQDGVPALEPKRPTVPLDGRLVSIPGRTAKHSYPAYGEAAPAPTPAQTTPLRMVATGAANQVPVSYPAYGER
jgi:hypothetical protein